MVTPKAERLRDPHILSPPPPSGPANRTDFRSPTLRALRAGWVLAASLVWAAWGPSAIPPTTPRWLPHGLWW